MKKFVLAKKLRQADRQKKQDEAVLLWLWSNGGQKWSKANYNDDCNDIH
jgi:hypothetical protein